VFISRAADGKQPQGFLAARCVCRSCGRNGPHGLLSLASPELGTAATALHHDDGDNDADDPKRRDTAILVAAEIAEALAVTTYTNIIDSAPFFSRLPADDQGYLVAARS